jgi:hypothetical protein
MANPFVVAAQHYPQPDSYYRTAPAPADVLESRNPLVRVTGARRIGKSWFLRHVEAQAPAGNYLPLRAGLAAVESLADVVYKLWQRLPPALQVQPAADAYAGRGGLSRFLEDVDRRLEQEGRELVLLLDEEEAFARLASQDRSVLDQLSDAFYDNPRVRVVLAVSQLFSRTLSEVLRESSWVLGDFEEVNPFMAELCDAEADRLIRQTQSSRPLEVDDDLCARIRCLTNNHPYLLQLACFRLYDRSTHRLKPFEPHFHGADGLFREVYRGANDAGYFREVLAKLTDLEKILFLDMAAGVLGDARRLSPAEHEALSELQRFGYVCAGGADHHTYVPSHDLWAHWLRVTGDDERKKLPAGLRPVHRPPPVQTFDLLVRGAGPGSWEVACLDSPAGQSDAQLLSSTALSTAAVQARTALKTQTVSDLVLNTAFGRLGEELGRQLVPAGTGGEGGIEHLLKESLKRVLAAQASNTPAVLRIRLRLWPGDAAHDEPWEACCCPTLNPPWLSLHPRIWLCRFLPHPAPAIAPGRTGPLRILLAHAEAPSGMPSLDYAGEWATIRAALRPALESGRVEVEELLHATRDGLQQQIADRTPHVVHLTAHGLPGKVYLADGEWSVAEAADCYRGSSVQLAVLCVCRSVRLAGALAGVGVPCAIGMHALLTDQFAQRFSRAFYEALGAERTVDEALLAARDAVAMEKVGQEATAAWAVPVLYSRRTDGVL